MVFYDLSTSDNNRNICFQCDEIDYDMSLRVLFGEIDNSNRIFQFSYYGGKNFTDILRPYGFVYLISSKLQRILDDNEISGFKLYDAELRQKNGEVRTDYKILGITGRCNDSLKDHYDIIPVQNTYSGTWANYYTNKKIYGWDGSDIFVAPNTLFIFINLKLRKILLREKISNIHIESLKDIRVPM